MERKKYCEICKLPYGHHACSECVLPAPPEENVCEERLKLRRATPVTFLGRYQLQQEVGRGGTGMVFRAVDVELKQDVAVKFLLPEAQCDPRSVARFRREARLMTSIEHQNVARVLEHGQFGSADFLVLEFIEGSTLEEYLCAQYQRSHKLLLSKAVALGAQAILGLEAVHGAGIIHRDVKPSNFMLRADGRQLVLMDFGLGTRLGLDQDRSTQGNVFGTPAYMAPEAIRATQVNPDEEKRADLYSLGVTLFELLTGKLPFEAPSWLDLLLMHLDCPAPAPSTLRPEIPPELDELVLSCLGKDPSERPSSVTELAERWAVACEPVLANRRTSQAPSVPPPAPRAASARRSTKSASLLPIIVISSENERLRGLAQRLALGRPAWAVVASCSHECAVNLATSLRPSLVVVDLERGETSGLEVAATLRRSDWPGKLITVAERYRDEDRALLDRIGVERQLTYSDEVERLGEALARDLPSFR